MWKVILHAVKATFPLMAGLSTLMNSAFSQQNIIADKDNTRPETKANLLKPARITSFSATRANGYNELQWAALSEEDTRRFIVEYSTDGANFQTAGEMTPMNGVYILKHYSFDLRPMLYRIRIEKQDGKFFNTAPYLLEGIDVAPVKVYPTSIETNVINIDATFPVERLNIVSSSGQQVYAQDMGGITGYTHATIPVLSKGMYLVTFYGYGWKSTSRIIVGR